MGHKFNNDNLFTKSMHILIFAVPILWVLFIGMLSYFNRFAIDDFYHIEAVSKNGIWKAMIIAYQSFGGRWTSYLLWGIVYCFYDNGFIIFLYSFLSIAFFTLSVKSILSAISKELNLILQKKEIIFYAIIYTASVFFISFGKGEIWLWVVSTAMYLNSLSAFILLVSLAISRNNNVFSLLILSLLCIFIGGAAETYAILFILFFLILILLKYTAFKTNKYLSLFSLPKLSFSVVLIIVSFIFSYLAPGNAIRTGWLPEHNFATAFYTTFKALGALIIFKMPTQIPLLLLFSAPWLYAGAKCAKKNKSIALKIYFKNLLLGGIILFFLLYFTMFPACYLLSESGPDRSLSLPLLLISLYVAGAAFYTGYCNIFSQTISKTLHFIAAFFISLVIIYTAIVQQTIVSKYSQALDNRIKFLQSLNINDSNHVQMLEPLPCPGFLYSAEISSDTAYFANDHFKRGTFINFKVALKK